MNFPENWRWYVDIKNNQIVINFVVKQLPRDRDRDQLFEILLKGLV